MPILRRDETPDTLAPRVLYLWRKKWWILFPPIAAFVLAYLLMLLVPEQFIANAEIYVNRLAVFQDNQLSPVSVAAVARSDEALSKVRSAYEAKYGSSPQLEKFVTMFRTKTEVIQDTATRKDFSPIIQLSAYGKSRGEAYFVMQEWLKVIVRDYSNIGVGEAVMQLQALTLQDAKLNAEIEAAEQRRALFSSELPLQEHLLAEQIDLIAPSRMDKYEAIHTQAAVEESGSLVNTRVEVSQPPENKTPGLLARLTDARVNALRASSPSNESSSPTRAAADSEGAFIEKAIDEKLTSITAFQAKVADLRLKLSTASREVELKSTQQKELRRFMDRIAVIASLENSTGRHGGDLRVLTQPAMPDVRVWPKRTLIALIVSMAVFVVSVVALLSRQYLHDAAGRALSAS